MNGHPAATPRIWTRNAPTPEAKAWAVTTLALGATIAMALFVADLQPLPGNSVNWLIITGLMAVAERYRLHLHFGKETHSFSLAELPTALGLFFISPLHLLLARGLGSGLVLAGIHRRSPLKLTFNIVNGVLEAGVAVLIFRLITSGDGAENAWLYGSALLAVMAGSVVGIALVWLVIRIFEGHRGFTELRASLMFGVPVGLGNVGIALCMAVVWRIDAELLWIPLVPLGLLFVAYRAYSAQWQRRDALDFLYETAVEVQSTNEVNDALHALVRGCREQLKASAAELVAIPAADAGMALVVSVGPGSAEEVRSRPVVDLPLETRELIHAASPAAEGLSPSGVWVRASVRNGGVLLLRARDPIGNAARFDDLDLEVLRSMARLAVTNVERAELDDLKAAFLSAVSHELRTPLTAVLGIAALLKDRSDQLSGDQKTQLTDRLDAQAQRLDRLLSDLLDLDRLARGIVAPRRQLVDVVSMVHRVVETLDIDDHAVVTLSRDAMLADIDPALTERIISNLVKNAAKYSPPDTVVTIDVHRREEGVVIAVEDEGQGIPEHRRASVLDPFVRLHHDHPQPGTGIGLTLVRRFAQLHGGEVTITDGAMGGARVTVVLPDDVAMTDEFAHPLLPGGEAPQDVSMTGHGEATAMLEAARSSLHKRVA